MAFLFVCESFNNKWTKNAKTCFFNICLILNSASISCSRDPGPDFYTEGCKGPLKSRWLLYDHNHKYQPHRDYSCLEKKKNCGYNLALYICHLITIITIIKEQ